MENFVKKIVPNVKQKECIEALSGPVMVLAGPGTGKTFTLIQRIEYMLLNKNFAPETILCLAFSEAAANEMKVRLVKKVGAIASSVEISTYHSFCNKIITQYPVKFELMDDVEVIDELTKYALMREIIDKYQPKALRTVNFDPYHYIKPLLDAVSSIKLNRADKNGYFESLNNGKNWGKRLESLKLELEEHKKLANLGKRNRVTGLTKEIGKLEEDIAKAKEAWDMAQLYISGMQKQNLIDFNDMINFVLNAFENDPEFARDIRKNYDYIMVDEYQDTNKAQNELIFKLCEDNESPNIMVVGDDDQLIYQFQGAQTDNLEKFLLTFPNTKVICLEENNRSTQAILDFSRKILKKTPARLENAQRFKNFGINKRLIAKNSDIIEKTQSVELHSFQNRVQETNFIIDKIQEIINTQPDLPLSEIAILARTNSELNEFVDLLKNKGIEFQTDQKKNIFDLKPSLLIYLYLKAIDNSDFYAAGLFPLLNHPPFSFNVEDYSYLMKNSHKLKTSEDGQYEVHRDFISILKEDFEKHEWKDYAKIKNFINTFDRLKTLQTQENIYNFIIHLINLTGILEFYTNNQENFFENMSAIKKITDEAKKFQYKNPTASLSDFLGYLDTSLKQKISISIDTDDTIRNAVQIMTAHKAKGREFEYVFLTNMNASKWENSRDITRLKIPVEKSSFCDDMENIEDETAKKELEKDAEAGRLLFVSITRAKYALYLTHSLVIGKTNQELSKFISHILQDEQSSEPDSMLKKFIYEITPDRLAQEYVAQFKIPELYCKTAYLEQVKAKIKKHTMSATSLSTYESCPRKFLYSYIYKIPTFEYASPPLSFGIAVHEAIEKFSKVAVEMGYYPEKDFLISSFRKKLGSQPFENLGDRAVFTQKGLKLINNCFEQLKITPIKNIIQIEEHFNNISLGVGSDEFMIKGKIDRIENINDIENSFVVKDYKTGSVKSKAQIETGEYSNLLDQLKFYKLLYETQYPQRLVNRADLIFVEGVKTLEFELTKDDKEFIKEKIFSTFKSINKLEFDPVDFETQKSRSCEICNYKLICKMNTV